MNNPPPPGIRSPTFSEQLGIDAYKTASAAALSTSDSAADKIVTAAFSIATAFGALIALVAPKDSTNPIAVSLPFLLLGVSVVLALVEQNQALPLHADDQIQGIEASLTNLNRTKRRLNWAALGCLGLGIAVAGVVIATDYRHPAPSTTSTVSATIYLTPAGQKIVGSACGATAAASPSLAGKVDPDALSGPLISVEVNSCAGSDRTIVLPPTAIDALTLRK